MYALLLTGNSDERAVLAVVLQRAGLSVTRGVDLEHAMQVWPERPTDLIVIALEEGEPLSQVRRIRRETMAPVIAITDQVNEDLHCELLEAGTDLVITRPYSARLLIAMVRTLLHRAGNIPLSKLPTLSLVDLSLDSSTRTVQVASGPRRRLTHLEFRLLYTLMTQRDQVLSTDSIVEQVWGYSGKGDKELVRGLVRRLRLKVEPDPSNPRYIHTVPGLGYTFGEGEE